MTEHLAPHFQTPWPPSKESEESQSPPFPGWYRDLNSFLRESFGFKVQKIPLDAGLSCPNRDGTIGSHGCIYCDSKGSGTGAAPKSISQQILDYISRPRKAKIGGYLAYFQSFTNTYAPVWKLKELYDEAVGIPGILGLCIGTRPDCLGEDVLALLGDYASKGLMIWLEMGLQSAHDETLVRIRRGHDFSTFQKAAVDAERAGLLICVHLILGLPGETREHMRETARRISSLPLHGVKLHGLYVVKGTEMERILEEGSYEPLTMEEYVDGAIDVLERIPPSWVVHRLTSDPDPRSLVSPSWMLDKRKVIDAIKARMSERGTRQGRLFAHSQRPEQEFSKTHPKFQSRYAAVTGLT